MRPIIVGTALVAALLCLLPVATQATQVIPRSAKELGSGSALVVRATVEDVRSFWSPSHTKILTEVTVRVEESYKGSAPRELRLLQLGGVVDGVRVTVSGALHWKSAEEVLLFLEPYVEDSYQVSGFSQGKFAIERDERTGEAYISRRALDGIEWVPASSAKVQSAGGNIQKTSLDRFLDEALGERQEGR